MINTENITVNAQSSIKIKGEKTIYFDPFEIKDETHDADVIFVTHDHFDHFDPASIAKIKKDDTVLVAPASVKKKIADESGIDKDNLVFVKPGEENDISSLDVKTVPAYNVGKLFHPRLKGYVGYIVTMDGIRYFVTGDTDANKDNLKVSCDVLLVPVGGKYTMDAEEAAEFTCSIKPDAVIPTHYGSVVGDPDDGNKFSKAVLRKNNQISVKIVL